MTEPTDDELDAVLCHQWPAFSMQATLVRMWVRAAMREAIAKWGTPPAVAGEPEAWEATVPGYIKYVTQSRYEKFSAIAKGWYKPYKCSNCTTPQPTQAQSGAVPLTVDEVEQLIAQWSYELHGDRARYLVRMTEQHHGIKGGQHGAE